MFKKQYGFSLVEALIVCVVASILTMMAIPMLEPARDGANADAAAQLIAQELNLARALAVGTHGNILVQIDPNENSIVVAPGTGSVRGPFPLPGRMLFLANRHSLDTPDALGGKVLGAGTNTQITFLDSGVAATDGTGTTICSGTLFLQHAMGAPATMRAVTLLGGTGRVHVWRYDPKTTSWK